MLVFYINYLIFQNIFIIKKSQNLFSKIYRNSWYHTNMVRFGGKNGIIPGLRFGDTVGVKTRFNIGELINFDRLNGGFYYKMVLF